MKLPTLVQQINKIYKSERVRGQRALLLKHKLPLPPHFIPTRHRVLALLQGGHTPREIASQMSVQVATIHRHIRDLRRAGQLPHRQTKREKVAALHASGLSRHQIAAALNTTPQSVSTRLYELRGAITRDTRQRLGIT